MNIKALRKGIRRIGLFGMLLFLGIGLQAQTVFRGKVLDETTQQAIMGAKIGISDHGIGFVTNENGSFTYRKYNQTIGDNSELKISARGYEDIIVKGLEIREFYNKSSKFVMTPLEQGTVSGEAKSLKSIALFWDTSLSSATRDFDKEWQFLTQYFQDLGPVEVSFVAFSETIVQRKKFSINKDIYPIQQFAQSLSYKGATSYEVLPLLDVDIKILLSDGNPVLGSWKDTREIPYYAITSIPRANQKYFKSLALYTGGCYVNLSLASVSQSIEQVKKGIPFLDETSYKAPFIMGSVRTSSGPIQGASLTIKGDLEEFLTKSDGSFNIPARVGDILKVRYLGMYPKEMLVQDEGAIDVVLTSLDELLEEVILEGKKRSDKKTVDTGFGEKNEESLGISVNTITKESISPDAQYLGDVIRGKFAGVTVNGFGSEAVFAIRGNTRQPPIWVIDGSVYPETPTFVDPKTIHSITIIKSVQATLRYGSLAVGGAFVVKTNSFVSQNNDGEIIDQALVKGNEYTEQLAQINLEALSPNYVKQVQQLTDKEEQYKLYENLVKANTTNATFYIDMALFFEKSYPEKAEEIRSTLAEIAQGNAKVLRVLAYLYENAQDYKNALTTYERVALLIPSKAQSYRDLAKAHKEAGNYDKSLELYINMLSGEIRGVNFKEIKKALGHELLHLVARHKDKIDHSRLPEEWLLNEYRLDLRMVIEWSDPSTPFEFQFVNPEDKYFKWNHTLFDNKERLESEVKLGYQFEEFVINQAPHGLWIVNIEYLGEDKYTIIPPYLKYTIYRDYGSKVERKETIILKLTTEIGKAQLHEFLL